MFFKCFGLEIYFRIFSTNALVSFPKMCLFSAIRLDLQPQLREHLEKDGFKQSISELLV